MGELDVWTWISCVLVLNKKEKAVQQWVDVGGIGLGMGLNVTNDRGRLLETFHVAVHFAFWTSLALLDSTLLYLTYLHLITPSCWSYARDTLFCSYLHVGIDPNASTVLPTIHR